MKKDKRKIKVRSNLTRLAACGLAMLLFLPNGSHSGGGHEGGCGNVFGDLIHILRDAETGQPILEKRWVELPGDEFGFDYCPIPIDVDNVEIPFAPLSCDPLYPEATVEVDYFGRLNGGRTKERNNRMHFDEVISSIKGADIVKQNETGRLTLGYGCKGLTCDSWSTIDSPMESMALYTRLMKYGHFQTDPMEVDQWSHGDPALDNQYHPALDASDWAKFQGSLRHLAPDNVDYYGPEPLDSRDFTRASIFLGASANKTGKVTADLVQYLNRFLKITQNTHTTSSNMVTLPALIREGATIYEATYEVEERFVDFSAMEYSRREWHDDELSIIRPMRRGDWGIDEQVSLLKWLEFIHDKRSTKPVEGIVGFVGASSDALRTIEFVHNYEIPQDLGWDFK